MMSTPRVIYGRRICPLGLADRGSADPSPKARFWEQHPAIEMLPAFAVVALSEDNECNRDLSPLETDCLSRWRRRWLPVGRQSGSNLVSGRLGVYRYQSLRGNQHVPFEKANRASHEEGGASLLPA